MRLQPDDRIEPFGRGWMVRARRGFRPCPWAFELARFAPVRGGDRVVDLGCGNGVLLRALAEVHPAVGLRVGVELHRASARRAAVNARLDAQGGFGVLRADVRRIPLRPRFDLVLANPPFYPPGWGREAEATGDGPPRAATHALHGDVADFARAAARLLVPHGQAVFVFDADRLPALLLALDGAGLTCAALRFVDDDRGRPSRVLTLARRGGNGLIVERIPHREPTAGACT